MFNSTSAFLRLKEEILKVNFERIVTNPDTYAPTLSLRVFVDVEYLISIIQDKGRDESLNIIGEMFYDSLSDVLDDLITEGE